MSQDEFADHLGVARRTVATWHARPEMVLRSEVQRALDTVHERASDGVRARFALHLTQPVNPANQIQGQALSVAVAVVTRDDRVLLVCRRDAETSGVMWQFPAGVVKPGGAADHVAVRETLAETGVHCTVRAFLGERIHPVTGVHCTYWLCDYLAGEAENRDTDENISTIWAPRAALTRFIPAEQLYPPVLAALEEEPA
ncbi:NUDIX hydrolase [Streptosporangium saharense]|uniref:NUDIX hydrolase n=1 Tax=Streptosporangium saharense TaxID=1706840 RepID=UPI0034244CBD